MKNKIQLLLAVVFVSVIIFPSPAFAWSGVVGDVIDSRNLDPWGWGGQVWVIDNDSGDILIAAELPLSGSFNFPWLVDELGPQGVCDGDGSPPYDPCVSSATAPTNGANLELIIIPAAGSQGTPGVISTAFTQNGIPLRYRPNYLETGTGPNAIELVDFSVTPQANGSTWLPFALLIGSVALVSGAVAVIRKRKA